jgi:hypothetical protein
LDGDWKENGSVGMFEEEERGQKTIETEASRNYGIGESGMNL